MKIACLALIAILSTIQVMAQADRQQIVHLSDANKPFTLNVSVGGVAINVSGYEGKDVVVEANAEDITAQEKNNEVTVKAPSGKAIKLNIKVPRTAGIFKLSSVNGGRMMVSDVTGNLELQNRSGGITALNISGTVVASTVSGSVIVFFKQVDQGAAMAFSTVSGSIYITFPATLKANLKVRSDNSKVFSDFELASDPAHPQTLKTERDGFYHMQDDDWIYGRVGGGGPEMLIKNTTGNIYIRKAR
jgi:hypothetical protein